MRKQIVVSKMDDYINEIQKRLSSQKQGQNRFVIGVDGFTGVQKSITSEEIYSEIKELDCLISLDKFLFPEEEICPGTYIENIDFKKLEDYFQNEKSTTILVEGICLLAVLEKIGVLPDLLVYIKRMSASCGRWADAEMATDGIENYNRRTDMSSDSAKLDGKIVLYHEKYAPLEKADIIFEKKEEKPFVSPTSP